MRTFSSPSHQSHCHQVSWPRRYTCEIDDPHRFANRSIRSGPRGGPRGCAAPRCSIPPTRIDRDDRPVLAGARSSRVRHPCSDQRLSGKAPCRRRIPLKWQGSAGITGGGLRLSRSNSPSTGSLDDPGSACQSMGQRRTAFERRFGSTHTTKSARRGSRMIGSAFRSNADMPTIVGRKPWKNQFDLLCTQATLPKLGSVAMKGAFSPARRQL
jgi:hypothetical protein